MLWSLRKARLNKKKDGNYGLHPYFVSATEPCLLTGPRLALDLSPVLPPHLSRKNSLIQNINMKLLIISLMMTLSSLAASITEYQAYSPDKKKYEPVRIQEHQGLKISENCFKNSKPNCDAWKAVSHKVDLPKSKTPLVGNPAARYCHAQDADNLIFKDKQQNEYDFCVFKDKSAIDAWSLYNKHFGGAN